MRPEGEGVNDLVFLNSAGRFHVLDAVGVNAAARAHQEDARCLGLPVDGRERVSQRVGGGCMQGA